MSQNAGFLDGVSDETMEAVIRLHHREAKERAMLRIPDVSVQLREELLIVAEEATILAKLMRPTKVGDKDVVVPIHAGTLEELHAHYANLRDGVNIVGNVLDRMDRMFSYAKKLAEETSRSPNPAQDFVKILEELSQKIKEKNSSAIPKEPYQALMEVRNGLSAHRLSEFSATENPLEFEFTLGREMVQAWALDGRQPSPLRVWFVERGVTEVEGMVRILLTSLHDMLHHKPFDVEQMVQSYLTQRDTTPQKEPSATEEVGV